MCGCIFKIWAQWIDYKIIDKAFISNIFYCGCPISSKITNCTLFRISYSYPEVKSLSQILYHCWTIPLKWLRSSFSVISSDLSLPLKWYTSSFFPTQMAEEGTGKVPLSASHSFSRTLTWQNFPKIGPGPRIMMIVTFSRKFNTCFW